MAIFAIILFILGYKVGPRAFPEGKESVALAVFCGVTAALMGWGMIYLVFAMLFNSNDLH